MHYSLENLGLQQDLALVAVPSLGHVTDKIPRISLLSPDFLCVYCYNNQPAIIRYPFASALFALLLLESRSSPTGILQNLDVSQCSRKHCGVQLRYQQARASGAFWVERGQRKLESPQYEDGELEQGA